MSDEAQLIEEAKAGDLAAFEKLVSAYEKKIYNYCLRMTNSHEDAEDLTQEVFVRVCRGLRYFMGSSKFSTWIYRIAHNVCIDRHRKSKVILLSLNQPKNTDDQRETELPAHNPSPEVEALRSELKKHLLEAISKLKPKYRSAIVLRDIQQYSYEEIAEVLHLPLGTVKSHISRARAALRESVRPYL